MKVSKLFMPTLKEAPGDADIVSHKLLLRAGFIKKIASGIYEWLPVGYRVLKKVEKIIREEMDAVGGQEVWLPALLPKGLWEETGRWGLYGKELMRVKDRHGREFALGPTHEEAITDIVRKTVHSYRQLPLMLYQLQTKFRDEIRPRFGIMRAREFYMKDAYSFHVDDADAKKGYDLAFKAYNRIFERCGLKFRAVEAMTGAIGGSYSHEFMVLADTGEEAVVSCSCGYAANVEKAEWNSNEKKTDEKQKKLEEVHTPHVRTVEEVSKFLKADSKQFIKTLIYLADGKPVMVLMRGDGEIEEHKLQTVLGCGELMLAGPETVSKVTGAPVGFAGPVTSGERGQGTGKKSKDKITIIADKSVEFIVNGISGANKKDYHAVNICIGRDYKADITADIRKVQQDDLCIKCGKKLDFARGIEVGHTFMLGKKYSHAMKAVFIDEKGTEQECVMGCYGIGISRMVAATIEQNHDKDGIIWPVPLAPFQVIIIPINYEDPETKKTADALYEKLKKEGIDVLLDDRPDRAGVKFKDADLIGIPVRLTVSGKKLKDNKVELKLRSEKEAKDINIGDVLDYLD